MTEYIFPIPVPIIEIVKQKSERISDLAVIKIPFKLFYD